MYEQIVLDLDNTLVRSGDIILSALSRMLEDDTGSPLTDELRAEAVALPTDDALTLFGYRDLKEAERRWNEYIAMDETGFLLYDGAAELLRALKKRGLKLGIITSRFDRELWDSAISPFKGLFSTIVTRDDVTNPKPHKEPMCLYLERAGARREELLFVGDSPHDAECARAAGVDFALALWGSIAADSIRANYRLSSPLDVLSVLDGIMARSE